VPASHYIHPECRLFLSHPPRFRRRLRVALGVSCVVAGVGAAVIGTADRPKLTARRLPRADQASIAETTPATSLAPWTPPFPDYPASQARRPPRTRRPAAADTPAESNCVPSSCASRAWFGWRTIAQQSLRCLLSAVARAPTTGSIDATLFAAAHRLLKATRRGPGRGQPVAGPASPTEPQNAVATPKNKKAQKSARRSESVAATITGMALRPAREVPGRRFGRRAVTRQGAETISAHTVAGGFTPNFW